MLIGLCGPAGAGKNTVASVLGWRQVAFADPLYRMISAMTGLPVERLQDRSLKERPIEWVGKSPRQLLQTLGTEWGRGLVSDDVWVKATMHEIQPWLSAGENVAITDVRFNNEAEAIRAVGGRIIRVARGVFLAGDAASHVSEAGISPLLVDAEIDNSGSLDDLRDAVVATILRV